MPDRVILVDDSEFTPGELSIIKKYKHFYESDRKYLDMLIAIIEGKSNISIRVIEWFVINYSQIKEIKYHIKIRGAVTCFYVNREYNTQMRMFTKEYFDPFCRKRKVFYRYKDGKKNVTFVTSIGQLNFYYWAIKHKVIRYIENHISDIEENMRNTIKSNKQYVPKKSKKKKAVKESNDPDPEICSSDTIDTINLCDPPVQIEEPIRKRRKKLVIHDASPVLFSNDSCVLDFD